MNETETLVVVSILLAVIYWFWSRNSEGFQMKTTFNETIPEDCQRGSFVYNSPYVPYRPWYHPMIPRESPTPPCKRITQLQKDWPAIPPTQAPLPMNY